MRIVPSVQPANKGSKSTDCSSSADLAMSARVGTVKIPLLERYFLMSGPAPAASASSSMVPVVFMVDLELERSPVFELGTVSVLTHFNQKTV